MEQKQDWSFLYTSKAFDFCTECLGIIDKFGLCKCPVVKLNLADIPNKEKARRYLISHTHGVIL